MPKAAARRTASGIVYLYATAPSGPVAERIAKTLIDERLAACVNILSDALSVYRWKGDVERAREAAMIVKTTRRAARRAMIRLRSLHPYETPAIVAFRAAAADAGTAAWIDAETAPVRAPRGARKR